MLSQSLSQRRSSASTPLPRELALRLEAEADGLVQHHVRAYEAHVYQQRREELRDPKRWTRVTSSANGSFRVYRRVRQAASTFSSSSQQQQPLAHTPAAAMPTQLLGVGFTVGSIDDMLFGASALTTAAIKIQSLDVQDPVVDAAVLAVLRTPTPSDPLRSVTLKWILKPPALYGVSRHRDYVYIESIGICRSAATSERIGYCLVHSIELPSALSTTVLASDSSSSSDTSSDSDVVKRRRVSSCYLFRALGSGLLECYLRASTDASRVRRMTTPLVVYATATKLLHICPGFMRVAETNKLIFALQQRALSWSATTSAPAPASRNQQTATATTDEKDRRDPTCSVCLETMRSRCRRRLAPCVLCDQLCCTRCVVVWKARCALTVLGQSGHGSIVTQRLRCCRSCILAAQATSPLAIIAASRLC